MVILFIGFLIVALTIIFAGHYFIYYSLINFLTITNPVVKLSLAIILFLLPLSFFIASALAHLKENIFTRSFYFASSLWLGIAFLLLVFFIDAWILIGLTKLAHVNINTTLICWLIIFGTTILSAYSIYNAYHPIIKNITVTIPHLPDAWKNKTAVQLTDVHVGHVLQENFLRKVVTEINQIKPDLVFVTGDLLDGMDGDLHLSLRPLNDLVPPLGKYFVTGNHETYFGIERATKLIQATDTKILNDEIVNIDGVQIIGISYPERGIKKAVADTILGLPNFTSSTPSILLYHDPVQIEKNKNIGINLQLSGHTHAGQIWPFGYITRLIYGRYYNGLNTSGSYSIYTSAGIGVWGPTMRLGSRPEITVIHFVDK